MYTKPQDALHKLPGLDKLNLMNRWECSESLLVDHFIATLETHNFQPGQLIFPFQNFPNKNRR